MTPSPIKPLNAFGGRQAYTLVEVLVGLLMIVLVLAVSTNFYNIIRGSNAFGLTGQVLQDGANIVLAKIIQGGTEATGIERLSQGVAYCIGSGTAPSCSLVTPGELHYWDMNGVERWFRTSNDQRQLIFHHPTAAVPAGQDEAVYTAPDGAGITLTFWIPTTGNYPAADVNINVSLSRIIQGKTVTGTAATQVNLRNHP